MTGVYASPCVPTPLIQILILIKLFIKCGTDYILSHIIRSMHFFERVGEINLSLT
jgi:hypothetical protein